MKRYFFDLLCIIFFTFIVAIFFYPTILQGKLPIPTDTLIGLYHPWRDLFANTNPRGVPFKNFLITDPIRQQIPWRKLAIDEWKKGNIPIWNASTFSGTPLSANIQAAVFYPFNFLFLILSFPFAWTSLIFLEPLLSGIFMYAYLKQLKISPLSSLFGAIIWSFSGFSIAWLTWGTVIHVSLWLPIVLLSIDKLFHSNKWVLWSIIMSLTLIFQLSAGHIQIFFYTFIISLFYFLWRFFQTKQKDVFFWVIPSLIVFLVIGAIQWVPFIEMFKESSRIMDPSNWLKEGWFLPWQNLIQFFIPDFFGNPATMNYWGVWNYGEFIGFIGIVPILFALYSLVFKNKETFFWKLLIFGALLFMLPTPIAKIPYELHLPVFSSLQPTRLMVVVDFSLVMLAVFGLDTWVKEKKTLWSVPFVISAFFLIAWIYLVVLGKNASEVLKNNLLIAKHNAYLPTAVFILSFVLYTLKSFFQKNKQIITLMAIGFIGVTAFELLRFGWKFTPFTAQKYFFPDTKIINFLSSQPRPFKIMEANDEILPPNTESYYGIESISGYDPVYLSRYEEFIAASERGRADINPPFGFDRIITPHNIDSPILPLLNIKYVLSLEDINRPFVKKVFQEGETRIYEYTRFLPRVFFPGEIKTMVDKKQLFDELFSPDFHPERTVLVEENLRSEVGRISTKNSVAIDRYEGNSIIMHTDTKTPQFLFISNIFYPGWKATVDGQDAYIYRSDYIFIGVVVPAGGHQVILKI